MVLSTLLSAFRHCPLLWADSYFPGVVFHDRGEAPGTGHCVDLSAEGATQSLRDLSLNRAYSAGVRPESSSLGLRPRLT